jgi:hypothetical protein
MGSTGGEGIEVAMDFSIGFLNNTHDYGFDAEAGEPGMC